MTAKLDLAFLEGRPSGTYQVPLELNTDFANTGVYAFGEYMVNVTING